MVDDLEVYPKAPIDQVKRYMAEKGLKQPALAARLQMHQSALSRVLSGEHRPSLELALKLQVLCGVPANDWCGEKFAEWQASLEVAA